ncbi:uncharacterized protein LOC105665297 [Ceratitis capitata]|uniref:uncharacterized protein LOC105665297 n=1 Tax=Ceratitis capitata TaxID=7213 RepID=UPI0006189159|nr:uncharacterized protein LOC105665297 [Ceratitis capitata]
MEFTKFSKQNFKRQKRITNFSAEQKHKLVAEVKAWPRIWDLADSFHSDCGRIPCMNELMGSQIQSHDFGQHRLISSSLHGDTFCRRNTVSLCSLDTLCASIRLR